MKYLLVALGLSVACALQMEEHTLANSAEAPLPPDTILAVYHPATHADDAALLMTQTMVAQTTERDCYAIPSGDREVASGSVSSRWTYLIIQQGRGNRFYVAYWPQTDCSRISRTSIHSTQNDAYQEFRRRAEEQAY